ncbi:hypothetical protein [Myroides sp. LoEW2-1]|uniref:hypothetical protein n=1 Tax=Myroides sp. LoEW2-1 TaxID=2683192 RepID=UPI0014126DC6|nr:hypothetical protein [Myroides sp. LoEW2-1]
MDNLINKAELSKLLGYKENNLRSNRLPHKHKEKIQELNDLLDYWKKRYNL